MLEWMKQNKMNTFTFHKYLGSLIADYFIKKQILLRLKNQSSMWKRRKCSILRLTVIQIRCARISGSIKPLGCLRFRPSSQDLSLWSLNTKKREFLPEMPQKMWEKLTFKKERKHSMFETEERVMLKRENLTSLIP